MAWRVIGKGVNICLMPTLLQHLCATFVLSCAEDCNRRQIVFIIVAINKNPISH